MSLVLWILLSLAVFSLVVFVHELGHFLVARKTGMKVDEFGIGIPPRAKRLFRDKKGTIYTLNWLPIGGFVRIHGEDRLPHEIPWEGSFHSKTWFQKSLVLLAGVTMNFLLAYLIFIWLFLFGAKPIGINPFPASWVSSYFLPTAWEAEAIGFLSYSGRIVLSSLTGSVSERAGVTRAEYFHSLHGESIWETACSWEKTLSCTPDMIIREIRKWKALTFTLENASGSIRDITLIPENGKIGSAIGYEYIRFHTGFVYPTSFLTAFSMAGKEFTSQLSLTWYGLSELVRKAFFPENSGDRDAAKAMVAWPIGIGSAFVQAVESNIPISVLFLFIALISLSLGFFNLLPLPALDGGRFVTLTIVSIVSHFIDKPTRLITIERTLISLSFLFLIGLSLFIAFIDIEKLFP